MRGEPVAELVRVEVTARGAWSLALEAARVPLVDAVSIENRTDQRLERVRWSATIEPHGGSAALELPPVDPGARVTVGGPELGLGLEELARVGAPEVARLEWRVERDDQELARGDAAVDLLPRDLWPADRAPAQLLATFVVPDHPVVGAIVQRLSGDPDPVERVGSLLALLSQARIRVEPLPAGFESEGVRIRPPDRVLADGRATTADLVLLLASCLERLRLGPVIGWLADRLVLGVWLGDDRFPEGAANTAARVRQGDGLLWLDPAGSLELEAAADAGARALADDARFRWAVDVRVVRAEGWSALPPSFGAPAAEPSPARGDGLAAELLAEAARTPVEAPRPPVAPSVDDAVTSRFRAWKDRLLDLSLRNRLLAFRPQARTTLPLEVPDLPLFADRLAGDTVFDLVSAPPSPFALEEAATETPEAAEQARAERIADLVRGIVPVPLADVDRMARAVALDRAGRLELEEGGANTLFAAIGFLRWSETGRRPARADELDDESTEELGRTSRRSRGRSLAPETERLAPLLLVPIALEISRSTRKVRIRRLPEDPVANVTLVEKLRRDFDLDLSDITSFDQQDRAVDVAWTLSAAREAIAGMPGWEVLEQAALATLTFTKFLLWRDLEDNAARLLESPVVQHIARRVHTTFPNPVPPTAPEVLDAQVPAASLPLVLDADATQTAAIHSALNGRSFVLQGPPGTGKSQTIANLVAAAIGTGKTALVVAEKMAALDVVHRRLKEVGLGDACLELHSHKANKREVIASLAANLRREMAAGAPPWEARAAELEEARTELNAYVKALHAPRPLGLTFYEASGRLLAVRDEPVLPVELPRIEQLTERALDDLREHGAKFATAGADVEPVPDHPWSDTRVSEWSVASEQAVQAKLAKAAEAAAAARETIGELARALEVSPPAYPSQVTQLAALGAALAEGPLPPGALDPVLGDRYLERTTTFSSRYATWQARSRTVASRWHPSLYTADLPRLAGRFADWAHVFPLVAWFMLFFARRELRVFARKRVPDNKTVAQDLGIALQIEQSRDELAQERKALHDGAAGTWAGQDPDELARLAERGAELREKLAQTRELGVPLQDSVLVLAHPSTPAERRRALGRRSADAARAVERLKSAYRQVSEAVDAVPLALPEASGGIADATPLGEAGPFAPAPEPSPAGAGGEPTVAALTERIERWSAGRGRYRAWARYGQQVADMEAIGLGSVVEAHRSGRLTAVEVPALVERSVLARWVDAVRDAEPALRDFSGPERHRQVARFRRLDQAHLALGARQVGWSLEQRLPRVGVEVAEASEPGILLREASKKTRQKAVRRLLQEIPNLISRLKPCLLMSPLSVAQYLPADGRRFDLVVFDEASQIGTHDAIGALARGAQVIVVGDSRQLPPTTFFQRATSEEADENDFDELESILEEAVASGLPEQMLGWHYRSRHEALIRFSNDHYYDGRLAVFPAAVRHDEGLGITWHPVRDGVYEKARSRTNPREARALVDHLVAALLRTVPGERTFGVVTFSQAQQTLIDDLLDEARRLQPAIEPHFAEGEEPVFVKNLENVQGDERDEILFSVGYGPDESGRVWMNFGPLNREGGERRLNVAVTRARLQLRVFSTLTHEHIDLARTRARGARHLREFLRYAAEQGAPRGAGAPTRDFPTTFERQVAEALITRGWEVETRVGCGVYRVDLAVVHPERPGEYLLGVELDGPAYAAAATARDRDRLRQEVLEGLGWRLHRIWSSDWWFDRDKELRRLEQALDDALGGEQIPDDEPTDERELAVAAGEEERAPVAVEPYVEARPAPVTDQGVLLHDADLLPDLRRVVLEVLEMEAPIHLAELTRRVGSAFGLTKLTAKNQKRVLSVARKLDRPAVARDGFLWMSDVDPDTFDRVRGPTAEGVTRDVEHIPPEEILCAARRVLADNLAMPHADLVRETARLFGILRVGRKVADLVGQAIERLVERGEAELQGERVVAKE